MKPGSIHEIESLVPGSDEANDLVLVMHDDEAFLHESSTVLVIPIAPVPEEVHGHPLVRIAPTVQNGLNKLVVAAVNRLHDVDRARIGDQIGEIDRSVLIDVYRILDRLIGRQPPRQRDTSSGDTRHEQL